MIQLRPAGERGRFDHGWLDTRHTFSFGDYYDPNAMGFRALRVMNEDFVQPGAGFPMHRHRDMEIVTIVLEGSLEHRDSLGNGSVLRPGEIQRMSAGAGIRHSEFNPSSDERVHLYQIWLLPDRAGHPPGWEQKAVPIAEDGTWTLVVSPDGERGSLSMHQDARLLLAKPAAGQAIEYSLAPGRHAWLQVLAGGIAAAGGTLFAGDGLAYSREPVVQLEGADSGAANQVLLVDLP